jgi:protein-S-isoprenylcysteine O-methyltransferase Ste14
MMLFAGLALVRPDPLQAALSLAVWVAAIWQVRIEEPILRASLGEPYRDYAARTPRWLGLPKG